MSNGGHSILIRRVADNERQLVMFLGIAFFCVWVATVNWGLLEVAPRSFLRDLGWLGSDEVMPVFLSSGAAALVVAFFLWLFSGAGSKAFLLDESGVTVFGMGGERHHGWHAFSGLERNYGNIMLHLEQPEGGLLSARSVVFRMSGLDHGAAEIEALIVYHRPDLFGAERRGSAQRGTVTAAQMAAGASPRVTRG